MHKNSNMRPFIYKLTFFKNSILWHFVLVFSLSAFLFACSKKTDEEPSSRVLTLVTSADYPPFEFIRSGKVVGLDIDVAEAIAKDLGFTFSVQDVSFSGIIPALNSKRADFAMAGITVTPERLENVDFSQVYFQPSLAVLARADAPILNMAGLTGKRIGVQLGSTMEQFAKELATQMAGIRLTSLNRNPDLVQELKVGRLDAILLEAAQASAFAEANPGLAFTILPKAVPGYCIAFPKGSPWVAPFNEAIARLRAEGKLQAIETEWLSVDTVSLEH